MTDVLICIILFPFHSLCSHYNLTIYGHMRYARLAVSCGFILSIRSIVGVYARNIFSFRLNFFIEIWPFSYIFMLSEKKKRNENRWQTFKKPILIFDFIPLDYKWQMAEGETKTVMSISFVFLFANIFHSALIVFKSFYAILVGICCEVVLVDRTHNNKIKESFSFTRSMVDNTMKVFWVLQNSEQLRERKIEYANLCVVKTLCSWCLFELFFIVCAFTLT